MFTRWTKKLAAEAGVRPLTPHPAGRHTWATRALSSGKIHPKVVQERPGHSSISITLDRYSHVVEGTRIGVDLILEKLDSGEPFEAVLESHPRLSRDDVLAALRYAAEVCGQRLSTPSAPDPREACRRRGR